MKLSWREAAALLTAPFDLPERNLFSRTRPEEIANAINDNTAMIYTTDLGEKLEQELKIAKDRKVPMLLDDAAGIPPVDNAKLYARMGIDMYCFSGGKGLRGPQCSGLLLGRKDLIEAALLNSNPREGAICRPMKVGKEEVIGCLTALETWLKIDEKKLYEEWNARIDRIRKLVETVPGVTTSTYVPEDGNRYPTLRVKWDQQAWGFSISDCVRELRASDPIIEVLGADNPSLVTAVREGNPNQQGTQGTRSYRAGFHDDQARRGNYCRAKIARCAQRGAEESRVGRTRGNPCTCQRSLGT